MKFPGKFLLKERQTAGQCPHGPFPFLFFLPGIDVIAGAGAAVLSHDVTPKPEVRH